MDERDSLEPVRELLRLLAEDPGRRDTVGLVQPESAQAALAALEPADATATGTTLADIVRLAHSTGDQLWFRRPGHDDGCWRTFEPGGDLYGVDPGDMVADDFEVSIDGGVIWGKPPVPYTPGEPQPAPGPPPEDVETLRERALELSKDVMASWGQDVEGWWFEITAIRDHRTLLKTLIAALEVLEKEVRRGK